MPAAVRTLSLAVAGCALAACAGSSSPATPASPAPGGRSGGGATATATAPVPLPAPGPADWPQYHRDASRSGAAPARPAAGRLSVAWTRRLDGAVYGQPLVIGGLVIAATEGDSVYGLDRATGQIRWHARLGTPVPLASLPCGNIDPLGITGTPVYDPATRLVYAVAETTGFRHLLAAIAAGSGQVRFRRPIPAPDGQPRFDQQRSALALARGRVYAAFGGLFGDCGPYRGSVVGIPASGRGPLVSYVVPTAREGGIWGTAGPVAGPRGLLYVGVGNGAATGGRFDSSDSVTGLTPGLRRADLFAPASWAADNASDLDLGSTSPAVTGDGSILAVGKRGTGYLLNGSRLGGVGGQRTAAAVCPAFGGMSVSGTVVYVPCLDGGMAAVDTAGGRIRVRWRGPSGAQGSPVTGGGAVWAASYAGTLYELDPASGRVRNQVSLGEPLPHFASPSLSGNLALIGTMRGVTAVRGA
ncbi:MAG: PQQ-binding-like beta-propeller repeat protein [Actinobacteria bacterium]|nr:PQQ-binding-like beta-propeller repeat protein [Actinomycetota bacterium]MBO0787139.1 PQQ-binding-like beta-propeller repeat protein [Actinomycetota bacterium]